MTISDPFATLLALLGRADSEPCSILSMAPEPGAPMHTHWTTCGGAHKLIGLLSGKDHLWFGVQPMTQPASGRGKSKDVTSVTTLYADLDFAHEHKPGGMPKTVALDIIRDLGDILGTSPAAVVMSGYGLQPYWPIVPVDPQHGIILLQRWRQLVIKVAALHGYTVDTCVYDLPRILRIPGPPNIKYGTEAHTGLIMVNPAYLPLTVDQVNASLDGHLERSESREFSAADLHASGLPRRLTDSSVSGRVFTDAQAEAFLEAYAWKPARETPWAAGADYWKVLWQCALAAAMFSDMYDEAALKDRLRVAILSGHGEHANINDEYQIALGFAKFDGDFARRPNEAEQADPFSPFFAGPIPPAPSLDELRDRYDIPAHITPTTETVYTDGRGNYIDPVTEQIIEVPNDGRRRLVLTRADKIEMRAAVWLWEHDDEFWIPLGGLVLLGGREGVGKSTWTARLIAQVTNGTMEGEYLGSPKGVIIAAAEDSWESTILPRLVAAGADLKYVYRTDAEENAQACGLTLPTDVPELERKVREYDVALIVLDPLLGTVRNKLDTHKDSDVRQALAPMSALAHDSNATIIGLIHQNKAQGGDLVTRLMGSRAFVAVARAVLVCAEADVDEDGPTIPEAVFGPYDPVNPPDSAAVRAVVDAQQAARAVNPRAPRRFSFGQLKNNLGPKVQTSVMYEIEGITIGHDKGDRPIRTSKIKVLRDSTTGAYVQGDVEDMVLAKERGAATGNDRRRAPGGNQVDRCKEVIRLALLEGPATSAELKAITAAAGFNDSTVNKARAAMDLVKSGTFHAPVYSLPGAAS